MIDRELDKYIDNHYNTTQNALLLTGARQTGKTFAIRKYAERKGLDLLEINFLEDPDASLIFKDSNTKDILLRLSAYAHRQLEPSKTLIFFDEIQKCPEVVTMIKFLVDEGSFRYALSGSLLGVELNDVRSVPVGYMNIKEVFPLDLQEFVMAIGISDEIIMHLNDAWEQRKAVDEVIHNKLMKLVQLYLIVGGMPAAVQCYIDTNDIYAVQQKQKEIIALYRWDISQYDFNRKLYIREIFDMIPSELNAKNKRFILKNLNEHGRFSRYEDSFLWLKDAGVALPTYNAEIPAPPLKLNSQRNLFKLFQNDVGLLASQYADGTALRILSGEVSINYGAIYENLVAQELKSHGYDLYFYNSKKLGELDFLLEHDADIIPIEVKSGKDYERHNALKNVMQTAEYALRKAFVLCNSNLSIKDNIIYVPIYMLMFIKRNTINSPLIYKIGLDDLNNKQITH